jgi:putative transposase
MSPFSTAHCCIDNIPIACAMGYKYGANFVCFSEFFKTKMSHTHTNLLTHVVFSTKERLPFITNEIKPELFAYMGGLVKELKGKPIIINGMSDHVHLLISLPPNVSVSEAMRFVKANSSKWVKEKFAKPFGWQKGYGAFSVSRSNVDAVVKYIQNQEKHHRKFDFKTEFIALLRKNDVEFDEQYLWD